jgi:hypothetical protein
MILKLFIKNGDKLRNVKDKDEYFKKISIEFQNKKNK